MIGRASAFTDDAATQTTSITSTGQSSSVTVTAAKLQELVDKLVDNDDSAQNPLLVAARFYGDNYVYDINELLSD